MSTYAISPHGANPSGELETPNESVGYFAMPTQLAGYVAIAFEMETCVNVINRVPGTTLLEVNCICGSLPMTSYNVLAHSS